MNSIPLKIFCLCYQRSNLNSNDASNSFLILKMTQFLTIYTFTIFTLLCVSLVWIQIFIFGKLWQKVSEWEPWTCLYIFRAYNWEMFVLLLLVQIGFSIYFQHSVKTNIFSFNGPSKAVHRSIKACEVLLFYLFELLTNGNR